MKKQVQYIDNDWYQINGTVYYDPGRLHAENSHEFCHICGWGNMKTHFSTSKGEFTLCRRHWEDPEAMANQFEKDMKIFEEYKKQLLLNFT